MKKSVVLFALISISNLVFAQWADFQNLDFSRSAKDSLTGKAFWQAKDFVTVTGTYTDEVKKENPALKISGSYSSSKPGYVFQQHNISLTDFTKIRVSARIKASGIKSGVGDIYCYAKNGDQWLGYEKLSETENVTGDEGWKSVSLEIWINPKASTMRIGATLSGEGSLLIDDFQIEAIEAEACPMDSTHLVFMEECMDVIAEHSLYRNEIDTAYLMKTWQKFSSCAEDIKEVHQSLGTILRMIDNHSFYMPVSRVNAWGNTSTSTEKAEITYCKGHRIDEDYAYIWMPAFSSGDAVTKTLFANELQYLIDSLDHENLKGWVFDLRDNGGGNCWPMLAGIGPILGEGICGYFQQGEWFAGWSYEAGGSYSADNLATQVTKPYTPYLKNPPVAVLTSPRTASSGEVVTVAFRSRPGTRSFGQKTGGYSTGNANFNLSDGSMIFLATSVYADRDKNAFLDGVIPDVVIEDEKATEDDEVLEEALRWLRAEHK